MNTKEASDRFIEKIKTNNRIKLMPFSEEDWFRGAYSTVQRTLRKEYRPLSREQKESYRRFAIDGILGFKPDSIDENLEKLIRILSSTHSVSIGHSQKIISILIKYAFAVSHAFPKELPLEWSSFVDQNTPRLPVPIDAVVLHALKTKYPNCFADLKTSQSRNWKKGGMYPPAASILVHGVRVSWSRLNDYSAYKSLQNRIRVAATAFGTSPLEFEMIQLWPA